MKSLHASRATRPATAAHATGFPPLTVAAPVNCAAADEELLAGLVFGITTPVTVVADPAELVVAVTIEEEALVVVAVDAEPLLAEEVEVGADDAEDEETEVVDAEELLLDERLNC